MKAELEKLDAAIAKIRQSADHNLSMDNDYLDIVDIRELTPVLDAAQAHADRLRTEVDDKLACPKCRGRGELWLQGYKGNKQPPHDMRHMFYKCDLCEGLGFIDT